MPSTRVQLAEAIDRVMHKGAVLRGDVVISVADVDFLYLDLRVVLSAVDTAMRPPLADRDDASSADPASEDFPPNR
jgi:gas vesicle structural protein